MVLPRRELAEVDRFGLNGALSRWPWIRFLTQPYRSSLLPIGYDGEQMPAKQLAIAIVVGSVAIAVGVIPGLLEGLREGIERFHDSLSSFPPRRTRRYDNSETGDRLGGQIWFALGGVVLILVSLFAYFSD